MIIEKKPYPKNAVSIAMPVSHLGTFSVGENKVNFGYTNKGIEFHSDATRTTYIISWDKLIKIVRDEIIEDMGD